MWSSGRVPEKATFLFLIFYKAQGGLRLACVGCPCGKWAAGPAEGAEREREAGPSPREGESEPEMVQKRV